MIQATSSLAFESIVGELGERQLQVLNALKILNVANNRQISEFVKLPINSVTPRILECRNKKLITVAKVDKDNVTNRQTIFWRAL